MIESFPHNEPIFLTNYEHLYYVDEDHTSKILRKIILEQGEKCCYDINRLEIDEKLNEFKEGFVILGPKNSGQSVFRKYSLEGFVLFNFNGNDTHMTSLLLCGKTQDIKNILVNVVKEHCIIKQVHEWRVIISADINELTFYQNHGFSQGRPVYRNDDIVLIPLYYNFTYNRNAKCINLI